MALLSFNLDRDTAIYSLYDTLSNHSRRARPEDEIWQRIRKLLPKSTPLVVNFLIPILLSAFNNCASEKPLQSSAANWYSFLMFSISIFQQIKSPYHIAKLPCYKAVCFAIYHYFIKTKRPFNVIERVCYFYIFPRFLPFVGKDIYAKECYLTFYS